MYFQMIPMFALSLYFQTIFAYFFINFFKLSIVPSFHHFYYMTLIFLELVPSTFYAVLLSTKIKDESDKLLTKIVRLLYETENAEAAMKVNNFSINEMMQLSPFIDSSSLLSDPIATGNIPLQVLRYQLEAFDVNDSDNCDLLDYRVAV